MQYVYVHKMQINNDFYNFIMEAVKYRTLITSVTFHKLYLKCAISSDTPSP